ncbi:hypothetical protein [Actibacterium sp. MT2.3-13A]|uniref:hypothetical protein n=1 Tax=Actibacterium sp. MT2.3-13A TaxID=2828332 RepID=UPI001BAC16A4|nr:hypothetical protein [Actibacterium sp. MT2.3-13A]
MKEDPSALKDVFSQTAAIIAFFGALGGTIRALVLRLSWRETVRVVLVGAGTAFGIGTLSPVVLRWALGVDLPDGASGALGVLSSAAFIVGLISVALVERLIARAEGKRDA